MRNWVATLILELGMALARLGDRLYDCTAEAYTDVEKLIGDLGLEQVPYDPDWQALVVCTVINCEYLGEYMSVHPNRQHYTYRKGDC